MKIRIQKPETADASVAIALGLSVFIAKALIRIAQYRRMKKRAKEAEEKERIQKNIERLEKEVEHKRERKRKLTKRK